MTTEMWRCTVCKRPRETGDALPPLTAGLVDRFRNGKCKKCRAVRVFERVPDSQMNLKEGLRLKERGMAVAETHTAVLAPEWSARVDATIKALALSRKEFTSEDVTARTGMPPVGSGGAVGARMNAAAQRGVIVWTGRMAAAQRPRQHAALLKVWRGQ